MDMKLLALAKAMGGGSGGGDYFGETVKRVTLANVKNPDFSHNMFNFEGGIALVEGQTYYVDYFGFKFEGKPYTFDGMLFLGYPDPYNLPEENTPPEGEILPPYDTPFLIGTMGGGLVVMDLWQMGIFTGWEKETDTITFETDAVKVKTLDQKFLPFRKYIGEVMPELQVEITFDPNIDSYGFVDLDEPLNLTKDNMYTVYWDGVAYTCVAANSAFEEGMVMLGNRAFYEDSEDTGEPFVLISKPEDYYFAMGSPEAGAHTVAVVGEIPAVMPNAEGETVTAEEFNTLLDMLRKMGILAVEDEA